MTVTHRKPVQDENKIAGSVLGAVAGGVLGHQVGGGRGKDIATVAGALAGGYAGNRVQNNMQENDTYTTTQQRCQTVYDKSQKTLGYDVTYKIGDQQGKFVWIVIQVCRSPLIKWSTGAEQPSVIPNLLSKTLYQEPAEIVLVLIV